MTDTIKLPEPQKELSFPLMRAIALRRTKRKWKSEPLSLQELSDILWAACGITRAGTKGGKSRRTAPSACNSQAVKVFVALPEGLFLYNENGHHLIKILDEDIRKNIGTQKMMQSAPAGLIYVSDYSLMTSLPFRNDDRRWYTSTADTGFMSQNVYLYCAAANLNTAVLGLVDRDNLHRIMQLKENEKVVYTQVVGRAPEEDQ